MSKTGKFLNQNENTEIEQELADIHPFSQVKPKRKRKVLIFFLVVSTLLVYSTVGYVFYSDYKSKEKGMSDKKGNELNTISKLELPVNITVKGIEKDIREKMSEYKIPQISYYKKQNDPLVKFRYYVMKGKEAEIKGKYTDAISYYRKAWSINKKKPELLYRIAVLYYKIGHYKSAEKYSKMLLKINKNDLKALILLAKSYMKNGKIKKAKLILEEAYFSYPENKDVLENLGKIYEKENALIIAKDVYQTLADMGYLEGKLSLARVYEKLNDKKSALKIYRQIYEDPNIPEDLRIKIENKIISLE